MVCKSTIAGPRAAEHVSDASRRRQYRPGITVDVLSAEFLMSGVTNVVGFQNHLAGKLTLHTEVVVVNVGIVDALGQNNARQDCLVRTERCPSSKVAGGLSSDPLTDVSGGACKGWGHSIVLRTAARRTSCGTVDREIHIPVEEVIHEV